MKFNFSIELGTRRHKEPFTGAQPTIGLQLKSPTIQPNDAKGIRRLQRQYAAARVDRLTSDWVAGATSSNSEIQQSRKLVTQRARQAERDNPYVGSAIGVFENNVIGPFGIKLKMKVREGETLDKKANQLIEDAWKRAGKPAHCTTQRTLSREEMLWLCIASVVRDGGILFRKHRGFSNAFGYALQPIEIDQLDHDYNRVGGPGVNEIQFGIEYDRFRAPLFYHTLTRHPGDMFTSAPGQVFREKIPADQIIAVWDFRTRAGQMVGMPRFANVLQRLHRLDKYEESESIAARIASCKGGFLEKETPDEYQGEGEDDAGNTVSAMEPGMIEELPMGMKFTALDPKHPVEAFAAFVKSNLRSVAAGLRLSYATLAKDLSDANYSSMRSGKLEDRDEFQRLQQHVIMQLMDPWFEDWLFYAIMSGQVKLPIAKLDKFRAATWVPRGWPWVDPDKDVTASIKAIGAGLSSRTEVIGEGGGDIEEVDEENAVDKALHPTGKPNYGPAYEFTPKPGAAGALGSTPPKPSEPPK
jgi:lambda family phage portal protein